MPQTKKSRKGPTESATKFAVGTRRKGNDGNQWVIMTTSKGVNRWKKEKAFDKKPFDKKAFDKKAFDKQSKEAYLIHDNGDRPYCVRITDGQVDVFENPTDSDIPQTEEHYTKLVYSAKFLKRFVGKSTGDDTFQLADHKKQDAKKYVGNSMLFQIAGNKYVVVAGSAIFTFQTPDADSIIRFYSSVGRSDVPYPVAEGNTNIYFMLDKSYVPKAEFDKGTQFEFAYDKYYENDMKKSSTPFISVKQLHKHRV